MRIKELLKFVAGLLAVSIVSSCSFPNALIPNIRVFEFGQNKRPLPGSADYYEQSLEITQLYITVEAQDNDENSFTTLSYSDNYGKKISVSLAVSSADDHIGHGGMSIPDLMTNPLDNSYRIDLSKGDFYGSRVLHLIKSPMDITQMKSKLAYELFGMTGNLITMNTRFVNLHVRDLTSETNMNFVEYGIYTAVEEPDEAFLMRRGLAPDGALYKIKYYDFSPIMGETHEETDANFEEHFEVKTLDDRNKLLHMAIDVNNIKISDVGILSKHFDRENYVSWLAISIIIGNIDAISKNYLLYSPPGINTWYFIPWDNGTSFRGVADEKDHDLSRAPWREGISNYWGGEVHRRFLPREKNLTALINKVEELGKVITADVIRNILLKYYEVLSPYINAPTEMVMQTIEEISSCPKRNIEEFYSSLEKPMPYFTTGPQLRDDTHYFACEEGKMLNGGSVYYDFILARDPELEDVVEYIDGTTQYEIFMPLLPPGIYYYRFRMFNLENDAMQLSFDRYADGDKVYYGVKQCVVN